MIRNGLPTLDEAFALATALAQKHRGPGVLVFTASLQLLYINRDAQEYIRRLNNGRIRRPTNGNDVLPREIIELCNDVANLLLTHGPSNDWDRVQSQRVTGASQCSLLLRGFGLPHGGDLADSGVLILMEELQTETEQLTARVPDRYHLTDREQTIIIYLIQGLTNKEIANRLTLSEYTVKQHLKRVMKKTGSTTRTGVMARIIFASPGNIQNLATPKETDVAPRESAHSLPGV